MDDDRSTALTALGEIPLFKERDLASLDIARLGGLTNLVYRVEDGKDVFCLRVPGRGTEDYIDRKVEAHNAAVAAAAGVSPEVLFSDPQSGLMLSRFLAGCDTMTPETFCTTTGAAGRAGAAFRRLHAHPEPFAFRFELFAMIDEYLGVLGPLGAELPDGRRLFGGSKTWRGVAGALLATVAIAVLLGYSAWIGGTVAVFAILGDLISSFIKRRLGMRPSSMAPLLDQAPESLLPALVSMHDFALDDIQVIALVVVFVVVELLLSLLLYRLGVRSRPY